MASMYAATCTAGETGEPNKRKPLNSHVTVISAINARLIAPI